MNRIFAGLIVSLILTTGVATMAVAETKQITFAKGKSSAVVKGTIKGDESVDYVLRAGAGQTLNVDFKASKGAAFFNVIAAGGNDTLFNGMSDGNHYSGTLPSNGEYIIRAYLKGGAKDSDKPVTFTIKVGIPATGQATGGAEGQPSETAVAEKPCLAAVAKQVGKSSNLLKISDSFSSEAGIVIMVQVPEASAPWKCFANKKGKVSAVEYTGSEGAL